MTNIPDDDHDPAPPFVDPDTTLRRAAFDLGTLDDDDVTDGSLDELGTRFILATRARDAAAELIDMLELALIDAMPEDVLSIAGVGALTRSEKRRSSWIGDSSADLMRSDLRRAVVAAVAVDRVTGEVDPLRQRIASLAVDEMYDAIGSFTTVLRPAQRRLGIDMNDYRQWSSYYRVALETENDDQ
jgi:hypothetical protein